MNDGKLKRKTAIVTGGAQGIGLTLSKALLKHDFQVAIWEVDQLAIEFAKKELKDFQGKILCIVMDVSKPEMVKEAVNETIQWGASIDLLINNAAISANKPIEELEIAEWQKVIDVNLNGIFYCVKYAAKHLRESKGSIINLCSTRAFMSEPNTEAYSASKGGVFSITHALAISLGPDVRVNCISPGWIEVGHLHHPSKRHEIQLSEADHQHHPAGRVGKAEDIANMVIFLSNSANNFITGQNFVIDGGITRKMIY